MMRPPPGRRRTWSGGSRLRIWARSPQWQLAWVRTYKELVREGLVTMPKPAAGGYNGLGPEEWEVLRRAVLKVAGGRCVRAFCGVWWSCCR